MESEQSLKSELAARGLSRAAGERAGVLHRRPVFFGAVDSLDRALRREQSLSPLPSSSGWGRVPFMDADGHPDPAGRRSGTSKRHGTRVLLSEATPRVQGKLENAGIIERHPEHPKYFPDLHGALAAADLPRPVTDSTALAR